MTAIVMMSCGQPTPGPAPAVVLDPATIVGPSNTIAEWSAAPREARAAYFRGAVSVYLTDPAVNETQRRFDDDLALDLTDCVDAEIEQNQASPRSSVRPFVTSCLQNSGMPAPG